MTQSARIKKQNEKYHRNVDKRGTISLNKATAEEKSPVGPVVLALFIFVVCGSAVFQILQTVRSGL